MNGHLNLPLKITRADGCLIFTNATGDYVATVQLEQPGGGIIAETMQIFRKANAEYILRACNSHKALVDACEIGQRWLGYILADIRNTRVAIAKKDMAVIEAAIKAATKE